MLNHRYYFIFVLLCGLFITTANVMAQSPSLYTKDGKCRYYYFTPKNTQSWYIKTTDGLCDDGIVDGQGAVTVYNAFSQPIEEIYGFFNKGFWTGDMPLSAPVLYQTVESDSTQKVYFQIPNDTYYDFQLIGQMSSQKQKDGTYEAFKFCNPFRILLQTEESDLFTDDQKLIEIVDELVKKTRNYCPAEETLYFYASRLERPNPDEIFFFAEVDLRTARIVIKRNDPPAKNPNDLSNPDTVKPPIDLHGNGQSYPADTVGNIPNGNFENDMLGTPSQMGASSYMNVSQSVENMIEASNKTPQENADVLISHSQDAQIYIDLRDSSPKSARANQANDAVGKNADAKKKNNAAQNVNNEKQTGDDDKDAVIEHAGKVLTDKHQTSENISKQSIDKVPHLLLAGKIMRKPVQGTAIVYISDVSDDAGRSNKPNPLKLEGKDLTVGWAVISGDFEYQSTSNSGKLRGKVHVNSVAPCQSNQCRDIK